MSNQYKVYNQTIPTPFMTYIFLALNVAVYVYMVLRYNTTTNSMVLLEVGANFTPAVVLSNEWWRLITAAFIHIGFSHLLMNCLTLYFLGVELEILHGHWVFAIIYLVSAIGGNLFSFAFNINISAGASTAIFGMFASYLVLSYMNPESQLLKQRANTFTILLVLNFLNGIFSTDVDNWGHFGGAMFGAIITYGIGRSTQSSSKIKRALLVFLLLGGLTIFLIMIGRNTILG
ncbi:rhomboid family intramembrane serine protease [Aerococcaceae bacterium WGS1372]